MLEPSCDATFAATFTANVSATRMGASRCSLACNVASTPSRENGMAASSASTTGQSCASDAASGRGAQVQPAG